MKIVRGEIQGAAALQYELDQATLAAQQAHSDADDAQEAADAAKATAGQAHVNAAAALALATNSAIEFDLDNSVLIDPAQLGTVAETEFSFDKLGRVEWTRDAESHAQTFGYDVFGEKILLTNKIGGATEYTYDRRGLMASQRVQNADNGNLADWTATTYQYDARGNLKVLTEAAGLPEQRITEYDYDGANRLIETRGEERAFYVYGDVPVASFVPTETIVYDARGNVVKIWDAAGNKTTYSYDKLDRKIYEVNAEGTFTRYYYDDNGNISTIRVYESQLEDIPDNPGVYDLPGGDYRETVFGYDYLNRLDVSFVRGSVGNQIQAGSASSGGEWWGYGDNDLRTLYTYDKNGNVISIGDPNLNYSYYYYDELNQKVAQVDAEGYLVTWEYDAEGNVVEEYHYANKVGTQGPINPGTSTLPVQSLVASAGTSSEDRFSTYTYDLVGNRLSETRHNVEVYDGDGGSEIVNSTVTYTYNALGQVVQRNEAVDDGDFGQLGDESTYYEYDLAGRLVAERHAAHADWTGSGNVTPYLTYSYDGLGNLTQTVQAGDATTGERRTTYTYGTGGLLSSVEDAEGNVHDYFYDRVGNRVLDRYVRTDTGGTPHLEGVRTGYDKQGRVISQDAYHYVDSQWERGEYSSTEYNAYGEVSRSGINGIWQTENHYDAGGRLWATNAGDGVWKYFGYDANGNQTLSVTSAGANLGGTGDTPLDFATVYGMIGQADVTATYTKYDDRNLAIEVIEEDRQLSAVSTQTLHTYRTYNAFGDVATETDAAGATITYSYNTMGKLIRSESPAVQYLYENGSGNVASNWIKPSEEFYYDASGRLVAQRDANGTYSGVGTSGNPVAKSADTGSLTWLELLAGTGFGGGEALVTKEHHADGGVKETRYDLQGNARKLIDELGRTTTQEFDDLGRVVEVNRVTAGGLIDYYAYDELGERIVHTNNVYGPTNRETTDYDFAGRVISTRAFNGDVTTYAYEWQGALVAAGSGQVGIGGWEKTTAYFHDGVSTGLSETEANDIFGRTISTTNLGGHELGYTYDHAGRLVETSVYLPGLGTALYDYTYYNTGLMKYHGGLSSTADYTYDEVGRKLTETVATGSFAGTTPAIIGQTVKQAIVTYDALGRIIQYVDLGGPDMPEATITYAYDAVGNVASVQKTTSKIDSYGNFTTPAFTATYNRYDSMNRMVLADGILSSGQIVRGGDRSAEILYNAAGERVQVITTYKLASGASKTEREDYTYDAAGNLDLVYINKSSTSSQGALRSDYTYDLLGRLTEQEDFVEGSTVNTAFHKQSNYDPSTGGLNSETTWTRVANGSGFDMLEATATYRYVDLAGHYALGQVGSITTVNKKNGSDSAAADTKMEYEYRFYDQATVALTRYTPNNAQPSTYYVRDYWINALGHTYRVEIYRRVDFLFDENGLVLSREEDETDYNRGNPRQIYYRFDGRQLGEISNDGTSNLTYDEALTELGAEPPATGYPFRNGASSGRDTSDFNGAYDAVNSYRQSSSARTSYIAQGGESLQQVAAQVWGDASLWYKIAEANGLGAGQPLAAGQVLRLPANVVRSHNNASTFKVYDPSEAIGDIAPTSPKPPKGNSCGAFGQILLAVVAIGVAIWAGPGITAFFQGTFGGLTAAGTVAAGSAGAIAGGVVGGAVTGAVASVASQAVGVATGIQDKFSWKAVGLAALSGAVGAGFKAGGLLDKVKSGFARGALTQGASSILTQGLGVATGLQDHFDWAGVAAAAAGGGVGSWVGDKTTRLGPLGSDLVAGTAGAIANAATRSAINGESFGDNLRAAIPDAIGQALGSALGRALSEPVSASERRQQAVDLKMQELLESHPGATEAQVAEARSISEDLYDASIEAYSPQSRGEADEEYDARLTGADRKAYAAANRVIDLEAGFNGESLTEGQRAEAVAAMLGSFAPEGSSDQIIVKGFRLPRDDGNQPVLLAPTIDIGVEGLGDKSLAVAGYIEDRPWLKYGITAAGWSLDAASYYYGGPAKFLVSQALGAAQGDVASTVGGKAADAFVETGYDETTSSNAGAGITVLVSIGLNARDLVDAFKALPSLAKGFASRFAKSFRSKGVVPKGFANFRKFSQFGSSLRGGLAKAGYADTEVILQGSAVTGKSYNTGEPFDFERVSDFDIALSGDDLFAAAKNAGISLRSKGTRTGPLTARDLKALGLKDFSDQMRKQAGRPVNFMIFETVESAMQRTPSIIFPR